MVGVSGVKPVIYIMITYILMELFLISGVSRLRHVEGNILMKAPDKDKTKDLPLLPRQTLVHTLQKLSAT